MRLQLWDTAGQERFRSLTSNFFGRADGFVLCYDISNRPSFDHVIGWMRDIKTRAPLDCDIVLCGNKSDLDADRVVQFEEGKLLADEYGVKFFETSALTGQNVEQMFTALATTIKHRRIDEFEGCKFLTLTSSIEPFLRFFLVSYVLRAFPTFVQHQRSTRIRLGGITSESRMGMQTRIDRCLVAAEKYFQQ
mmetsp:Transcript_17383/g.39237  ORF Transcript_17383/g.39237 Transcript_17383/m.39237 type:complete len:192 (-) Transcript_17383:281-856(-)